MKQTKNTESVVKENVKNFNKQSELENQINKLALTIDKVEDEKLLITNQLKKALADYQNLESNTNKRLTLLYMQSRKNLAERLIPVVDDLTMAVKSKNEIQFDEKGSAWSEGVVGVLQNLEKSLLEIGLKKFVPDKGTKFDPSVHEALSVIEADAPGVIFDVIQPGYVLDDTVIRPSRVVVTK